MDMVGHLCSSGSLFIGQGDRGIGSPPRSVLFGSHQVWMLVHRKYTLVSGAHFVEGHQFQFEHQSTILIVESGNAHFSSYKNGSVLCFAASLINREGCCDTKTEQMTHPSDLFRSTHETFFLLWSFILLFAPTLNNPAAESSMKCLVSSLSRTKCFSAWEGSIKDRPLCFFLKQNYKICVNVLGYFRGYSCYNTFDWW